ncbi:J domain-containing protein [Ekhidna sp.]|uniref:J domain-containing protein n=1 Tax=Ekhidna sp. TaxID=2608089 RepID=UPI003B50653B
MNHYQILEVGNSVSQTEIKRAYRRLVKLYHPDINPAADAADRMILINEAYEILSNPTSRSLYDLFLSGVPVKTNIEEVTSYQKHREEYRAKRVKQERDRIIYLVKLKTRFYRYERVANMMFFVFGILLTVDYYFQPHQQVENIVEIRQKPFETTILTDKGTGISTSSDFMTGYSINDRNKILIKYSALFDLPARVKLVGTSQDYIINGSIYTYRNVFSIIILLFSAIVVKNKEYTDFRLSCGLVPAFFVLFMLLFILTEI